MKKHIKHLKERFLSLKKKGLVIDGVVPDKETPSLFKWYFCLKPRALFAIPIFFIFVYHGLYFIKTGFLDVLYFFQNTDVSWLAILLLLVFGTIITSLLILPAYISFASIEWFYKINIDNVGGWKRFWRSVGVVLLVIIGTSIIRIVSGLIFGFISVFS